MIHTILNINAGGQCAPLHTYMLDTPPALNNGKGRPVALILPGGGYTMISDRDTEPVAIRMNAAGFHAAVLRYSVAPVRFPTALLQAAQAVVLLREHAAEWHIDPQRVFVMGLSAGGHLAASLGTLWNKKIIDDELTAAPAESRPDGLVLAYPVINSGEFAHQGSIDNLIGNRTELKETVSLEKQADKDTPPAFIWHTFEDELVPVENSLLFAGALRRSGVPFELHIYPKGVHGQSLGTKETETPMFPLPVPGVDSWVDLAVDWIRSF
ncbi:acetylesterase [Spirochaetia bacterium]|nr:acetylesterase [Spirochaetia bacterium]